MATTTREASPRQYRFGTSGFRPLLLVPLMCLFAVAGCKGSSSHPATETWDVSIYGSQLSSGQGTYVFQAGGTWTGTWVVGYLGSYAGDVTCPIDVGKWSVDASGYLEGSGSGTASNPSSPTGHEKSHFILDVYGIVNSDGSVPAPCKSKSWIILS